MRIQSILRKAESEGLATAAPVVRSEAERNLALELLTLPEALAAAATRRAPNLLCDAVFQLAQSFSRFYAEHHILSETDTALRAARLGLAALVRTQIETVLGLLGIDIPSRM